MDQLFKLITIEGLPQTGKTTMAYERALSPYYKDSAIVVVSATQDTARDAKRRFALRLQNIASDKSITQQSPYYGALSCRLSGCRSFE